MGGNVEKILNKYKQHEQCMQYYKGFKSLYEDLMKIMPKSKKTLDLGCAYGFLSLMLSKRGDKVEACDMTDEFTSKKMLKDNGIKFFKHNIEKKDLPRKYDLITMTETIEHLNSNPLPVAKRIFDSLEKNGKVLVTTVAREIHGNTTSMNNGEKGLWNDLISWRDIPEYKGKWKDQHTYHYSQIDLVSLFSEAGFEIEDCYILNDFTHVLIGKKK